MKVLITKPFTEFKFPDHYSRHFKNKFLEEIVFHITKYPIKLNNFICNLGGINYIKVQDHDVWSFDATLSEIILQGLIKIKEQKKGSPIIENDEVQGIPESLNCQGCDDFLHLDDECKLHDRWNYILDEMIYAFEKKTENKYFPDEEQERIDKGLEYFGKFYNCLWT